MSTTARTAAQSTPTSATRDGASDFDFLFGHWKIHNRKLAKRLAGSSEWLEFEAQGECHPLPSGMGTRDEYRTEYWPGFVGLTVRFYNPESRRWGIYWTDSIRRHAVLEPPVVGSFVDGLGVFETEDQFEGRPIIVRYTWSRLDSGRPRWEQAFSPDAGQSWETNWVMDFERIAPREQR